MRSKGIMVLSGIQLFWLIQMINWSMVFPFIKQVVVISKQDAWISIAIGGMAVAVIAYLLARLRLYIPDQSLVQFSQTLLGRWFGRIVVLPYFLAWVAICAMMLRYSGDFIQSTMLDRTPEWLILLVLVILMVFLTSGGIGGIGRFNEIIGPVFFAIIFVSFFLNIHHTRWGRLLPVYYDTGWLTLMKGTMPHASLLGGGVLLLLVLIPFMHDPKKAQSWSIKSIGLSSITFVIVTILGIAVFGPTMAAKMQDLYFAYSRSVDIMDFIQNLDTFMFSLWIFGITSTLSIYLFAISYEMAQWLRLKNWRTMIWIITPIIFIAALISPGANLLSLFFNWWNYGLFPVCAIVIPFILWIATIARRARIH